MPRIKNISTKDNRFLITEFDNGEKKLYDAMPLINDVFPELKNSFLFNSVQVDTGGFGVVWNENIDLDRYDLYERGTDYLEK